VVPPLFPSKDSSGTETLLLPFLGSMPGPVGVSVRGQGCSFCLSGLSRSPPPFPYMIFTLCYKGPIRSRIPTVFESPFAFLRWRDCLFCGVFSSFCSGFFVELHFPPLLSGLPFPPNCEVVPRPSQCLSIIFRPWFFTCFFLCGGFFSSLFLYSFPFFFLSHLYWLIERGLRAPGTLVGWVSGSFSFLSYLLFGFFSF